LFQQRLEKNIRSSKTTGVRTLTIDAVEADRVISRMWGMPNLPRSLASG
jgi:hypothetical protein